MAETYWRSPIRLETALRVEEIMACLQLMSRDCSVLEHKRLGMP